MKKQYAQILLTVTCFLGLGVVAQAQGQRELTVTVPFDFVAAGKTLPAGKYTVSRVTEDALGGLAISSYENRLSVIVLPTQLEGDSVDDAKVSFKQIGDERFLNKIKTADGIYSIPVSLPTTVVGGVSRHQGMPAAAGTP
jgi:hypothetical protein